MHIVHKPLFMMSSCSFLSYVFWQNRTNQMMLITCSSGNAKVVFVNLEFVSSLSADALRDLRRRLCGLSRAFTMVCISRGSIRVRDANTVLLSR